MKLLQTFVVAGLLAGAAAHAGVDKPAAPQLEPGVLHLKEKLSLTEQQIQELDKLFKEARAKRDVLTKELRDISQKRQERMNAVLTQEQRKLYEKRWEVPEQSERSEP